ncbi:TonB-dependent receptor plug domain-containing protein [Sphingomonas colocasiae]|uniref:TonB-dependent receptor n=1 Tax=Sphingomonas colocasiae TaxID=1848973 RepID=A0ABS7PV53_9SPHN|nr:TonB-dependent receptor [Sphingomonas colocasiae]MBY8825232.1 TonB-dependent receptor [Sphingomonas colocasiae]
MQFTTHHAGRQVRRLATHASLAAIALAGLMPVAAQAQTEEPQAEAARDDIIVTGSRIRRDGFEAPTPVTVVSQEELQNQSPSNNIADIVNQLPALAGSTRPANSRLNLSSGQAGINALNLRNLGETRTLVLLNGRRSVGSTITGLVDVNTIPQALVKSVEIVTGGASAAYGSDAVAGVANFILDNKYTGLKISGDTGITTYGDGFNYSFSAAGGMSFAGGRGHILLSGEVAHRDGIFEVDRPWNQTGYVRIQDPNWTTNSTTPQFLIRRQVGAANSTPGGLITGSSGGVANRLRGIYFGDGGSINQFVYGGLTFPSPTGSAAPTLTQGGSWQVNDSGRRIGLDPEDDRYGLFGRLSFEVSDGVELFAEASYNKQKVFFNAGPNLATGITLQANNAFLINTLGAAQLAGINTVTLATTAADLPFRAVDNRREVQRYLIGAEGKFEAFGRTATWDIYGQYGRAKMREQLRNIMHVNRMNQATNAVFALAGNPGGYAVGSIQCAINVDADAANNDPNCRPLNRLGIGVADPAAINYVLGSPYRDEVAEQYVAGGNLTLTPFTTWAGDVSISTGAEWRKEKISGFVPAEFQPIINANGTTTNRWSVGNYLPTNGDYSVKEAYLETVVPLGFGLEFNGAVRATDYSTAGYVTTWKAGATWQPIEDIRVRITRSRDIRAPNLNELYQAGAANSDSVRNPAYNPADPSKGPATFGYSATVTGNTALKPEKADSWNIGAVVTPRFIPGFAFSADYFRIDLKDAIDTLSAQEIINRCYEGIQAFCDAITDDPARSAPGQPYKLFRSQPFNFASKLVRGIDFDASYRVPLDQLFGGGKGVFTLRGVATRYIDNITDTGVAGVVPLNTVGVNGGQYSTPKWIFRASASYDDESFSATVVGRGVSSGKYAANGIECQTGCPLSTTQFPTYDDNHVKGTFYVDLNIAQKVNMWDKGEGQFFINVTNLFNKSALLLPETGLAANSTFSDLLGRSFRVGFRIQMR